MGQGNSVANNENNNNSTTGSLLRPAFIVNEEHIVSSAHTIVDYLQRIEAKQDMIMKHIGMNSGTLESSPSPKYVEKANEETKSNDISKDETYQTKSKDISKDETYQTKSKDISKDETYQTKSKDISKDATYQTKSNDISKDETYQKAMTTTTTPPSGLKSILWIYNDKKLWTDSTLKKVGSDVVIKCPSTTIDAILCENGEGLVKTKNFDAIFVFYYLASGRDFAAHIKLLIGSIQKAYSQKIPIKLIFLKDISNPTVSVNVSEFERSIASYQYFDICNEPGSFDKLVLHMDKPTKQWDSLKAQSFKTNYDNLKNYVIDQVKPAY